MRVRIYTLSISTLFFGLLTWIKSQVLYRSKAHYTANEIGFYLLTDMWEPHHITTSFLHLVGRIFLIKWICVEIRQHNAFNSFDECGCVFCNVLMIPNVVCIGYSYVLFRKSKCSFFSFWKFRVLKR